MKIKCIKILSFLLIVLFLFSGLDYMLKPKLGMTIKPLNAFYALPKNTVDVLFLGTSHTYCTFDPALLYTKYGYSAYDMAGASQRLTFTYHYLIEALKTQSPKLIVLDSYACMYLEDDTDVSSIYRNVSSLKSSKNKWDAIVASVAPGERVQFVLPWNIYHSRYQELKGQDFLPSMGIEGLFDFWKGYNVTGIVTPQEKPLDSGAVDPADVLPLAPKTEEYFRKILSLAQEKNIPIVVTLAPYLLKDDQIPKVPTIAKIVAEYGVDFIDYNQLYDECELDFGKDFYNTGHLNAYGAEKVSNHMADYIHETFASLPDHRGDPTYLTWEQNATFTQEKMLSLQLADSQTLEEFIENLALSEHFVYAIALNANYKANDIDPRELLKAQGIEVPDNGAILGQKGKVFYTTNGTSEIYHKILGAYDLVLQHYPRTGQTALQLGQKQKTKVADGVNFLVYNDLTKDLVCIVGFNATDNYAKEAD